MPSGPSRLVDQGDPLGPSQICSRWKQCLMRLACPNHASVGSPISVPVSPSVWSCLLSPNLVRSSLELIYLKRYMVVKGTQTTWWKVFCSFSFWYPFDFTFASLVNFRLALSPLYCVRVLSDPRMFHLCLPLPSVCTQDPPAEFSELCPAVTRAAGWLFGER